MHESEEGAEELINALADAECASLLLHNLGRLDEQVPDERDAVHNTLGVYNVLSLCYCECLILVDVKMDWCMLTVTDFNGVTQKFYI